MLNQLKPLWMIHLLVMREKIIYQLERNLSLGGDVTKEMLDFLTPIEDNTSFVDLAAYSLCKQSLKQALLEVQNLENDAQMLIDDLIWENDRLDLINKALEGKMKNLILISL